MDERVRRLMERHEALKNARSGRMQEWQDIARNLLPRSGRFLDGQQRDKTSGYNKILDNTATRAHKVLASGLLAGASSPARPWFRLGASDPELNDFAPVKLWLSDVSKLMFDVYARSNTYKAMHKVYAELGAFGTGCTMVQDDFDSVIHHKTLTVGEYCLANDHKGRVCTIYRVFNMTVAQVVKQWGIEACSEHIKSSFKAGRLDASVSILHVVEPRADRDVSKKDNKNMPYCSLYIDTMANGHILSESGFNQFPAICPRWDLTGDDVYGEGLGLEALGDIRQLQHEQMAKAKAIDLMVNPPMRAPSNMAGKMNIFAGGITYYDGVGSEAALSPLYQSQMNLQHLLIDIQDVRTRIDSTFHADLFLMLANDTRSNITATEVAERHEEKLLMLGAVMENIHGEMLSPLIDITFDRLLRAGVLPPIPKELEGRDLNPEFISVLAQAQKMVSTNGLQNLLQVVGQVAQFDPAALDKVNTDQVVDVYANALGVDPRVINSDEKVAQLRQARADQQAAMQQQQAAAQATQAAQAMGGIKTDESNMLTDVLGGLQGYS